MFVTEKPWAKTMVLFSESTPTYKHSLKSYLSKMQCTWGVVIVCTAMIADPEERHLLLPDEVLTRTNNVVTSMGG